MVKIDCSTCKGVCCSDRTRAAVTPDEENEGKLAGKTETLMTKHGPITVMRQEDGYCVLYDRENNRCGDYANRPLDCRTYPYTFAYKVTMSFSVWDNVCPNAGSCEVVRRHEDIAMWAEKELPVQWLQAYTAIDDMMEK